MIVSAPGYESQILSDIIVAEGSILTQNISLSSNIGVKGLNITGTPSVGTPFTLAVKGDSEGSTNYRFSMHPGNGTSEYNGRQWTLMNDKEYTSNGSCDYTFKQADKYITVVWLTSSSQNVVSQGIPIIGWSVDLSDDTCKTNFTGIDVSGTKKVNTPITFTVNALNSCNSKLYYRFSMHPDYGTPGYDGKHWKLMADTEWISDNSLEYSFEESGKYIVVVWVSDTNQNVDSNGIPIIGLSVDIE